MIFFDFFYKQMIKGELMQSHKHDGYRITAPKTILGSPSTEKEILIFFKNNNLKPIDSLIDIYTQVQNINFHWELLENDPDTINQFKEDPWLKEHYFNYNYSWSVVKELLSGYLFVPPIEELLGRSDNQKTGYYVMAKSMGLDPNAFLPLDYHNQFTAVLKIKENKILDHVWLLDLETGEIHDMNITIEQYLNLAYQAKIFNGWQHVYLFKERSEFYELMKRFLPKIVPHIKLDLNDFGI